MARVIQVIQSETLRGNGITTVMRAVTQYWSLDGDLLAEIDPCPDDRVKNSTCETSPPDETPVTSS